MSYFELEAVSAGLEGIEEVPFLVLTKNFKYGVQSRVEYEISGDYITKGVRPGALFTNVFSVNGAFETKTGDPMNHSGGVNAAVVDGNGRLNADAIVDALREKGRIKIEPMLVEVIDTICTYKESPVSVLYNMLRLYLIIAAGGQAKDYSNTQLYNDGHVEVDAEDVFGHYEPFEITEPPIIVPSADGVGYPPDAAVPCYYGMSARSVGFLVCACSQFNSNGWRLGHRSPRLIRMLCVQPDLYEQLDKNWDYGKFTPQDALAAINQFVNANRYYEQFHEAYWTLITSLFMPVPRCAESLTWVSTTGEVFLPEVSMKRGVFNVLTEGSIFTMNSEHKHTFFEFVKKPKKIMKHAVAMTEHAYAGIFELMTAGPGTAFSKMVQRGLCPASAVSPIHQYMAGANFRMGTSMDHPEARILGMSFVNDLVMQTTTNFPLSRVVQGYEDYDICEIEGKMYVMPGKMRPAVYPIILALIHPDRYYLSGLSQTVSVSALNGFLATDNNKDTSRLLNLLRLAGYDAQAENTFTGQKIVNWAANSDGHCVPNITMKYEAYKIIIKSKRKHSWVELPRYSNAFQMNVKATPYKMVFLVDGEAAHSTWLSNSVLVKPDASGVVEGTYDYTDFWVVVTADSGTPGAYVSSGMKLLQLVDAQVLDDFV